MDQLQCWMLLTQGRISTGTYWGSEETVMGFLMIHLVCGLVAGVLYEAWA